MEDYTNQILRIVVAQVCQAIGWHTIQSTPLELLTDILHKYIQELSVRTFRYTQLYSRTDANLDDIGLAFRDLSINIPDLLEYINNVDSVPCAVEVPRYPVRKESSLNFLKPGSKEVITRPVYVHEYLPAIHPEKEEDVSINTEQHASASKPVSSSSDPSSVITDITNSTVNSANISNNKSLFKKPEMNDMSYIYKKSRLNEEEGRPTREISSVMMTSSGFISPAREGKLPDSKAPVIPDYKPVRPATPPNEPAIVAANNSVSVTQSPSVAAAPATTKPEKKSKKQRNSQAGPAVTETKEKRRKERHLAKIQKRKNDTDAVKAPSKRPKIRESRAKHHQETPLVASPPQSANILDSLPPVSLPSDLTIKTETVPVSSVYPASSTSTGALNTASPTTLAQGPGGSEKKPSVVSDELKLNSELDKQKYSIFKKISKKSREDPHKAAAPSSLPQNELYSSFPSLPESTTIRRVPAVKFDSPPHTDPNIIVVDDDTPPRISSPSVIPGTPGSQLLSMSPLPAGTIASASFQPPFFENQFMHPRQSSTPIELSKKQPRKPRKNKQQALTEQSAPLNLSNESSTKNAQATAKAPRKRPNKVGRPSKRGSTKTINPASGSGFPSGMGVPSMIPEGMKRDDVSPSNLFKANSNQFLTGMHRFPLINAFHFLAGPGLIPNPNFMHPTGNPLLPFRNPFGYNDFMGLRPPIRPPKMDETPSSPPLPPLPLDLESNIYCNVPPLVPDSLKLQLSPSLSSRSNKQGGSSTSTTSGISYGSLLNTNVKAESSNLSIFPNPAMNMPPKKSPKMLDAPIEISDDEKNPSDTELDKSTPEPTSLVKGRSSGNEKATGNSLSEASIASEQHSPSKDYNKQHASEPITTVEVNGEEDNELNNDGGPADTSSNLDDATLEPDVNRAVLKSDKKRDKEHKKGKRGKDGKIKKKKDKKDKAKNKEKAEKRKEEKKEKDRTKKKKEKRKEKGRPQLLSENDEVKPTSTSSDFTGQPDASIASTSSTVVPKLTLKFGSPQSVASDDIQEVRKMNTKSSNAAEESVDNVIADERRESSPELARISPLVTRPPKQKASTKEKSSDTEPTTSTNFPAGSSGASSGASSAANATPSTRGPGRPSKNSANISAATSAVQGQSTPATGTTGIVAQSAISASAIDSTTSISAEPKASTAPPVNERGSTAVATNVAPSGSNIGLRSSAKATVAANATSGASKQATTEPIDAEGNQVWICPACGRVDDGTPMIGCDGCDAWYHWVCVGIQVPPDEREDWYCRNCIIKKQEANCHDKKKKRKKKNKAV